ncbi:MAG: PhoH family protein, partial [Candidatus Nanopelagicaceae bacterium]
MERTLFAVPSAIPMVALLGPTDSHLRIIESAFPTLTITVRGNEITFQGDSEEGRRLEDLLNELLVVIRSGQLLSGELVLRSISMMRQVPQDHPAEVLSLNILSNRGRSIRPKTANQKHYVDAIDENTITFGIGPAGTGKT